MGINTIMYYGPEIIIQSGLTIEGIDDRERLIPWLEGDVILDVDIGSQRICVRWHPDD